VEIAPEMAGEDCEVCSKPMLIKHGRFGKFLACSGFPECRNSRSIVVKTGVGCPKCRQGDLLERRTRKRKLFFGCSEYPNCDFAVWKRPIAQPCPDCGNLLVESGRDRYRCQECGRTVKLADKGAPVAAG
jgi:DNA topoisomerase-1